MKKLYFPTIFTFFTIIILPHLCVGATIHIVQGDTVYLPYPMNDSCYFIVEARRYRTFEPAGFLPPYVDKPWIQWEEIYEATGTSEETLVIRTKIVPSPDLPRPYEVGTIEILGAGYYGIARISIVAIPKGPDEICEIEGDPMHPRRGDMFIQANDLLLAGRGLDINFSRYYSSVPFENPDTLEDLAWTVPFGFGWTHSFNNFLTVEGGVPFTGSNWSVRVRGGYRNYHCCSWNISSSAYSMKQGDHFQLEKQSVGPDVIWIQKQTDGRIYYFKRVTLYAARLDSIKEHNGNRIKLTYNSGNNLTKITDAVGRELNITYSGNRIDKIYESPNTSTPYLQYHYRQNGNQYDLIRVEKHTNTTPDTTIVLDRYFYDSSHLMLVRVLPTGGYGDNNQVSWDSTKGDRINFWYDSKRRLTYEEVVKGDGDANPANDTVIYRAHFRYIAHSDTLDSTVVYYEEDSSIVGARDPFTQAAPNLPSTDYYRKVIRFNTDGTIAWTKIHHPGTDLSLTTTYGSYDSDYNVASITDPNNKTTYYTWHSYTDGTGATRYLNRPKKIKSATGDSVLHYYSTYANNERFFLVDSSFDELDRQTDYIYESSGNLDTLQYYQRDLIGSGTPQDVNTDFDHNNKGNLIQIIDPETHKNYFHYIPNDTGPYLTESRVDIGNDGEDNKDLVTQYRYNVNRGTLDTLIYYHDFPNNPIKVRYYYDLFKRLYKITYPDRTYEEYIYDKRGNLLEKKVTRVGITHYKIQYEYDSRNHLTKVKEYEDVQASYDSTLYVYNLNDALTEFSNANDGATNTTIIYDYIAGRLYRTRYADNEKDSLGYYLSGYLKFKKDRRGQVIEYKYDDRWRLTKKRYFDDWSSYPNSPSDSVVFWLDKVANPDSLLDKNGKVRYDYDGLDRMFELNAYNSTMVKYLYDKVSNRTRMKVCDATDTTTIYLEQTYPLYDEGNRLLKTTVTPDTFEFTYWDTGPLKKIEYPNDVKEQYVLTSRNFIDAVADSMGNTQLFKFAYRYNELGDRDSLYFYLSKPGLIRPISGTITYSYDDLRRIEVAEYPVILYGETNTYMYDAVGNRLKKIVDTDTTHYTHDVSNNHLLNTGPLHTYHYDNNGNVVKYGYGLGSDTLLYDYENRLVQFVKRPMVLPPQRDTIWFTYCGLGKRIRKIEKPNAEAPDTTVYAYDEMYAVCEFGGHSNLLRKYVYANGLLLARYDESPTDNHYYHHDGLGSIMGMTNENGAVEHSYFYDEFGNSLGSWGDVSNHYLYTGQEYDGFISSLYNLRARYYKPDIGRFISEDPIFEAGSNTILCFQCQSVFNPTQISFLARPQFQNRYLYVRNNPINKKDIIGLQDPDWIAACAGVAACIERTCKEQVPPGALCKGKHDEKCRDDAQKWLRDCLSAFKVAPVPQLPYYAREECQGIVDLSFPYE